jgi:HEAT repeat protein
MSFLRTIACFACLVLYASAQTNPPQKKPPDADAGIVGDNIEEPDQPVTKPTPRMDAATATATAWQMIESGLKDPKEQVRIDALNALGTLRGQKQVEKPLLDAFKDSNVDVRVAAVAASSNTGDRNLIPALRQALDDPAPEVGFAAAVSLWKLHDQAGINILYGVLAGEQRTQSSFLKSGVRQANKDIHDPAALARIGAKQGAYALLGPFGIGLDAARLMMKSNRANSARVLTANLLAEDHSPETKQEFIAALADKDYFVRAASARALGEFHGKNVSDALMNAFNDNKTAVRFMAAASYIRANEVPRKHGARRH